MIENLQIAEAVLRSRREWPDGIMSLDWKFMFINYHPPKVMRAWTTIDGWHGPVRVFLHAIMDCAANKALYHPHPWPSAVKYVGVFENYFLSTDERGIPSYRMGVTSTKKLSSTSDRFTVDDMESAATVWMSPGSCYEMTSKEGWHYVAPVRPVLTLMVTGAPWDVSAPKSEDGIKEYTKSDIMSSIKEDEEGTDPMSMSPQRIIARMMLEFGRYYNAPIIVQ